MRLLSDYLSGMTSRSAIDDLTAERLLSSDEPRDHDLAALGALLDDIRKAGSGPTDAPYMGTRLAAAARSNRGPAPRSGLGRIASIGLAGIVFLSTAGVAWAADSAVPGDLLYGLDMTLEAVGIGAGGLGERAEELHVLIDSARADAALELLAELVDEFGATAVFAAMDEVAGETGDGAVAGRSKETGPPENAGPKDDTTTNPQGKETGPPENAGPKDDTTTNPQGKETGPKDK